MRSAVAQHRGPQAVHHRRHRRAHTSAKRSPMTTTCRTTPRIRRPARRSRSHSSPAVCCRFARCRNMRTSWSWPLYNTVLAGMAMDGKSFFYVNPLEVDPTACHRDERKFHVKSVRQKWFGCGLLPAEHRPHRRVDPAVRHYGERRFVHPVHPICTWAVRRRSSLAAGA